MRRKNQFYRVLLIVFGVLLWISLSFAAVKIPGDASWADHFDLLNIIVGFLFMVVMGFIVRTINKIDRNQTILFERITALSKDFYILEGEHRAMTKSHREDSRGTDRPRS